MSNLCNCSSHDVTPLRHGYLFSHMVSPLHTVAVALHVVEAWLQELNVGFKGHFEPGNLPVANGVC